MDRKNNGERKRLKEGREDKGQRGKHFAMKTVYKKKNSENGGWIEKIKEWRKEMRKKKNGGRMERSKDGWVDGRKRREQVRKE